MSDELPRKRDTRIVHSHETFRRDRMVKVFRVRDERNGRVLFEGEWKEAQSWRKTSLR